MISPVLITDLYKTYARRPWLLGKETLFPVLKGVSLRIEKGRVLDYNGGKRMQRRRELWTLQCGRILWRRR
jgi:hypothetical protein